MKRRVIAKVPGRVNHLVPSQLKPVCEDGIRDIVLDIGTGNAKGTVVGTDNVYMEASVTLRDPRGELVAVGQPAYDRIARVPEGYTIGYAVREGQLQNWDDYLACSLSVIEKISPDYWQKAEENRKRHRIAFCIAYTMTHLQRQFLREQVEDVLLATPIILGQPDCAGIGDDLSFNAAPTAAFIDIGAGTTDLGIKAKWEEGGSIMAKPPRSLPIGGNDITLAVLEGFKKTYSGHQIGWQTAERIKHELATAISPLVSRAIKIKLSTGAIQEVTSVDVKTWIMPVLLQMAGGIRDLLDNIDSPEMCNDLRENPIEVGGGGSNISGIDKLFSEVLSFPVKCARPNHSPLHSVVIGGRKILEDKNRLRLFDRTPPRRNVDPKAKGNSPLTVTLPEAYRAEGFNV